MKNSTRIMYKKHGWRIDRFVHNYIYFFFYYPYVKLVHIFLPALKHLTWFKPLTLMGKMVFDRYHAKVLSSGDVKKIIDLNQDVRVIADENKSIIPYKYATKIIFQEPEFIAVMDCPCKKSTNAPEADINSCISVGRGISSFWLEHCQKYHPRKISREEALEIIRKYREKNHITQAYFKVATGGSTGVICNCHPDTCVSLQATMLTTKMDKHLSQSAKSGYSITHDPGKCKKCGECARVCNFGVTEFKNGARAYSRNECLGCELCVEKCPGEALSLYIDPDKPLPLDLDKIIKESDL